MFLDRDLCNLGWPGTCFVTWDDFELLLIFLVLHRSAKITGMYHHTPFVFSFGSPSLPQTHCVAFTDIKLIIFLPSPPKCWDYGHLPMCQASKINDRGVQATMPVSSKQARKTKERCCYCTVGLFLSRVTGIPGSSYIIWNQEIEDQAYGK